MKMRSLSVVGLCFLLMVGMSWEVGAFDKRFEQTQGNFRIIKLDLFGNGLF